MGQWKLQFYANYFFGPDTCIQRHILDRRACQISQKSLLFQIVKRWRYSTQLKIKLQICIAQALLDRQPCNFRTYMRLLIPYNFAIWTYDLWPLDLRPFWIVWKTVIIDVLVGFSCKVHGNFYTWTLDLCRQNVGMEMILIYKMQFSWANENCSFMQIIILSLTHAWNLAQW